MAFIACHGAWRQSAVSGGLRGSPASAAGASSAADGTLTNSWMTWAERRSCRGGRRTNRRLRCRGRRAADRPCRAGPSCCGRTWAGRRGGRAAGRRRLATTRSAASDCRGEDESSFRKRAFDAASFAAAYSSCWKGAGRRRRPDCLGGGSAEWETAEGRPLLHVGGRWRRQVARRGDRRPRPADAPARRSDLYLRELTAKALAASSSGRRREWRRAAFRGGGSRCRSPCASFSATPADWVAKRRGIAGGCFLAADGAVRAGLAFDEIAAACPCLSRGEWAGGGSGCMCTDDDAGSTLTPDEDGGGAGRPRAGSMALAVRMGDTVATEELPAWFRGETCHRRSARRSAAAAGVGAVGHAGRRRGRRCAFAGHRHGGGSTRRIGDGQRRQGQQSSSHCQQVISSLDHFVNRVFQFEVFLLQLME